MFNGTFRLFQKLCCGHMYMQEQRLRDQFWYVHMYVYIYILHTYPAHCTFSYDA